MLLRRVVGAVFGQWKSVMSRQVSSFPITTSLLLSDPRLNTSTCQQRRAESSYDPYPVYDSQSPYKARLGNRRLYNPKIYTGGVLPRPEGEYADKPVPMPVWDPVKKDQWVKKKALFGQNDYIDILGDGTIHPWELIRAPGWLKGYRGNELQRISRQLAMQGTFLRETFPTKYHQLTKQLFYLYKRVNRRHHSGYWGAYKGLGRIDNPRRRR